MSAKSNLTSISDADPLQSSLTESKKIKRGKARWGIIVVSFVIAIFCYTLLANSLGPNRNLFSQIWSQINPPVYQISSGGKGGFYIEMGVGTSAASKGAGADIIVENSPSSGAFHNARFVMVTKRSFGFVQEDTLQTDDFERNHIRYITPLYLERLHIGYSKSHYKNFCEDWKQKLNSMLSKSPDSSGQDVIGSRNDENIISTMERSVATIPERPILSRNTHPCVIDYFASCSVSTGPPGSGTQVYARYLLDYCNLRPAETQNLGFSEALEKINNSGKSSTNIVFNIAGAPLTSIKRKLATTGNDFSLMSIDSAIAPELNRKYDLRLRSTTFEAYPGANGKNITTIGTYCFLICSPDVPDSDILAYLEYLDGPAKQMIKSKLGIDEDEKFQLDEFNFHGAFKQSYDGYFLQLIWNIVIFLSVFTLVFYMNIFIATRIISELVRIKIQRQVTKISHNYLPDNINLDREPSRLPKPIIYDEQFDIINRLISGFSNLLKENMKVRTSHDNGSLRVNDYEHLRSSIQNLAELFQRHIARRLNEFIESEKSITETHLRHYFTAGYIKGASYVPLKKALLEIRKFNPSNENRNEVKIFISYRRKDSLNVTIRLYEKLCSIYGRENIIFDKATIPPGTDFPSYLRRNIAQSSVILAIIGDTWMESQPADDCSDWVVTELLTAQDSGIPILPVLIADAKLPRSEDLPIELECIAKIQSIKLRNEPDDFSADIAKIVESIESLS